jgi:hypothetical protein
VALTACSVVGTAGEQLSGAGLCERPVHKGSDLAITTVPCGR